MYKRQGYYSVFGKSGARIEIPGCSLCMGNQARVADLSSKAPVQAVRKEAAKKAIPVYFINFFIFAKSFKS